MPVGHYHNVHRPGKDPSSLPCYFGHYECPYAAASPEELGVWLESQDRSTPFDKWLELYRARLAQESGILVHPSISESVANHPAEQDQALIAGLKRLAEEGQTIPFVKHNRDGTDTTIGYAAIRVEDGVISADITVDATLLLGKQLRLGLIDANSISIGPAKS